MEKLLDKEVHQMYKAPASSVYYSTSASSSSQQNSNSTAANSSSDNHEKGGNDDKTTEDGDHPEENDNGAADARADRSPNGNRPRSLPSNGPGGAPSSSRMRDLRQSHRYVEVGIIIYVIILSYRVLSKKVSLERSLKMSLDFKSKFL